MQKLHVLRNSTFYAFLFSIMTVALVFVFFPITAYAAEPTADIVTDWAGLREWLENHKDTGGTVVFGADIEADEINFQGDGIALPVIIDTASYGLTAHTYLRSGLNGVNPNAHITIMGEGIDKPVLSYMGDDNYRFGLDFFTIIAYGRDGQGGTAFRTNCGIRGFSIGRSSGIYTYGADAVGIDCGGDADLTWFTVESDGLAIQATGDLDLFGCHIIGGLSGIDVTLDTCDAPDIPGATVIHRKVSSIASGVYLILGKPYAYQVAGRPVNEDLFFESPHSRGNIDYAVVMSADGAPDRYTAVYVTYERADIDTQTIGAKTILTARIIETFEGIDILSDGITFDLTVETVDGRIPHFTEAQPGWMFYEFDYLYAGESLTPLTLWRSDDNGESWYKFWREDDPELTGATVSYYDDRLTVLIPRIDYYAGEDLNREPFMLAFETEGMVGGQVVFFDPSTGELNPNMGGDRDGGDRMILPWELFAGGDVGNAGGTGDASNAGNIGTTGNTGGGNPIYDNSHPGNTDLGQNSSISTTDPQDKPAAPNAPAASDMQLILDSEDSDASDAAVTEVPVKETQEDTPPPGSFPVIQHGDYLIMGPGVAINSGEIGVQQPLAPNVVIETDTSAVSTAETKIETRDEQVSELLTINDDSGRPETTDGRQETEKKAPSVMMDAQLSQIEPNVDIGIASDINGFPVVPVVAGLAIMGGAAGVAYMSGKRRLFINKK